ncbi:SPFH domain-containing protein [Shimazuella kribbensis]|uniref:SPFH domain-containing protein n=1 Tax=Shimazuella kribbensis TaxID=139808 RepID=UPI0004213661|nr:SPFH domain-containing protein [Shimazuella kribbensis]
MSLIKFAPALAPMLAVIFGAFKIITIVKEGQAAIKMRRGRAVLGKDGKQPKIYEPGLYFNWPFVESLKKLPTSEQMVPCDLPEVFLKDFTLFRVSAAVFFQITDVYKAQVKIQKDDLRELIKERCRAGMNEVLSELSTNEIRKSKELSDKLAASVKDHLGDWGVEITHFHLTTLTPDRATQVVLLAKRRAQALKDEVPDLDLAKHIGTLGPALLGLPSLGYVAGTEQAPSSSKGLAEGELGKE